jgi:hypothetical protein
MIHFYRKWTKILNTATFFLLINALVHIWLGFDAYSNYREFEIGINYIDEWSKNNCLS